MTSIDYPTVFFTSLIYIIVYAFWYSKFLFGRFLNDFVSKKSFASYIVIYLSALFFCWVIAILEVVFSITTFWDGVFFGFLIWLGIFFTHGIIDAVTYKKDVKIVLIDLFLYFLTTLFVSGILAG